jgi:hypothetical protein
MNGAGNRVPGQAPADERGLTCAHVVQKDVRNAVPVAPDEVRRLRNERHPPAIPAHRWMKARAVGVLRPMCAADASRPPAGKVPEVHVEPTRGGSLC